MNRFLLVLFSILIFIIACSTYHPATVETHQIKISESSEADSGFIELIRPYKNGLSDEINKIIGYTEIDLIRKKPESTLGNFVCDALMSVGSKIYLSEIDFVVQNYGGLRIDQINAGPISKGKMYELLPFENFVVVVSISGEELQTLLNKLAAEGGWPVSGIHFLINQNKFATEITIQNLPIDENKIYKVLMNDYMSNGGDNLEFLKDNQVDFLGITIRDAVIQYIEEENNLGRKIHAELENRIEYAK